MMSGEYFGAISGAPDHTKRELLAGVSQSESDHVFLFTLIYKLSHG